MGESNGTVANQATLPKSLRVIGWLTLVIGVWSVSDEVIRVLGDHGFRPSYTVQSVVMVAGAAGLLRGRRWGYLVTLAGWVLPVPWLVWFFFLQSDYSLAGRMAGILVILMVAIPAAFLLTAKARRWFIDTGRRQSTRG